MITLEMLLKIVGNENFYCYYDGYIYNGENDKDGEYFHGKENIKKEYLKREVIDFWEDSEALARIVLRGE